MSLRLSGSESSSRLSQVGASVLSDVDHWVADWSVKHAVPLSFLPDQVARVIQLSKEGLTNTLAKRVMDSVLASGMSVDQVMESGEFAVLDGQALDILVAQVIEDNAALADKVRDGKTSAVGALIGAVMKLSDGKADASVVRSLLLDALGMSS